jgi:hypothetical protein
MMHRLKHKKPSHRESKRSELRFRLQDGVNWIVRTLVLPVITSILCQYLVSLLMDNSNDR